jgi:hypothetical protein
VILYFHHSLLVTSHLSLITHHPSPFIHRSSPTTHHPPLITHHLSPVTITRHPPSITCHPLPITHHPSALCIDVPGWRQQTKWELRKLLSSLGSCTRARFEELANGELKMKAAPGSNEEEDRHTAMLSMNLTQVPTGRKKVYRIT